MNTSKPVLTGTFKALAACAAYVAIQWNDQPVSADGQAVQGVSLNPAAVGDDTAILLIGTVDMVASGAIAKGDALQATATGAKTAVDGTNNFATAMTAAADGEFVKALIR